MAAAPQQTVSQLEHLGRRVGKPEAGYIDDLAQLRKAIILCGEHAVKFNYRSYHYFRETKMHVRGNCDACRQHCQRGNLFMPLEYVEGPNQTWTPQTGR